MSYTFALGGVSFADIATAPARGAHEFFADMPIRQYEIGSAPLVDGSYAKNHGWRSRRIFATCWYIADLPYDLVAADCEAWDGVLLSLTGPASETFGNVILTGVNRREMYPCILLVDYEFLQLREV